MELAFKHLFRSQHASVPTEHLELRLSLAVLDQLPQSTPKTIVDVLSVHLGRDGITRCRCAAVAFDLDQAVISVIAVFSSMATGFDLAAVVVEFHFFAHAAPVGVDRLDIAVLSAFCSSSGSIRLVKREGFVTQWQAQLYKTSL